MVTKAKCIMYMLAHQLGPRYEGQLMSDGGAYSPFRLILLVLTHVFIITCAYGRTGSDGHEWVIPKRTLVACHFSRRLWRWGGVSRGPRTATSFGPQHELLPARLVLHRQTSAQNGVRGRGRFRRGRAY